MWILTPELYRPILPTVLKLFYLPTDIELKFKISVDINFLFTSILSRVSNNEQVCNSNPDFEIMRTDEPHSPIKDYKFREILRFLAETRVDFIKYVKHPFLYPLYSGLKYRFF